MSQDPIDDVAAALLAGAQQGAPTLSHLGAHELPRAGDVARMVDDLRALLFPGFVGDPLVGATAAELKAHLRARTADALASVRRQVYLGLHHRCQRENTLPGGGCATCHERADQIACRFLRALPDLRELMAGDVRAALDGDPAATGADEVILCYPGVYAITAYRIANLLLREGAQIVPRVLTELSHQKTGIDIHPGATIGRGFFIDHGTGVVIGETTIIGDRVRIYQGVTLGALSLPRGNRHTGQRRHPTIEDDVVIYANATILGGTTVIGKGAVIGGNTFVTTSVAPGTRVSLDPMLR